MFYIKGAIVFMAMLASAAFADSAGGSKVITLTTSNFEHETQAATGSTTGDWLIEFYAPWCGHCKKLQPIWEDLAVALEGKVNVAKVDVTENRDLGTRFEIKGFPTIKFFHAGEIFTYRGKRSVEDFTAFVNGGYKTVESVKVPKPMSFMESMIKKLRTPIDEAMIDIKKQKYTSPRVIVLALPLIFMLVIVAAMCMIPSDVPKKKPYKPAPVDASKAQESTNKDD